MLHIDTAEDGQARYMHFNWLKYMKHAPSPIHPMNPEFIHATITACFMQSPHFAFFKNHWNIVSIMQTNNPNPTAPMRFSL